MNHKYLFFALTILLIGCDTEEPLIKQQYYSVYTHNNSDEEVKNVRVYKKNSSIIVYSSGILPTNISKSESFLHIPPVKELVVRWKDTQGVEYEKPIDLNGIFPTEFDGGDFHIVINNDFNIDYTFVTGKIVYSPTNRTAK